MRVSCRPTRPAALAALVLIILSAAILALPTAAAAETMQNAAGRYDGLALRDLGGKQAALVQLVAEGGAFTPLELWRSKKGAFDLRKATFVASDVNGDGIGDGIVLYDLGRSRSRLYVYLSDGFRAKQTTAWTSKAGAFARARAKLAVTDLNGDGRDDVIALYDRGRSGATLYRFVSAGTKFKQTIGWSARRGFSCALAQLAAGDVTGDGRGDAIVLYRSTSSSSRLDVFVGGATTFTKKTFWGGTYAANRARLAAGDADSDGDCDAICLYRKPDNSGRLDVFLSSKTAFSAPAVWYQSAGGPIVPLASQFCVGDVTGDGRADVVTAASSGGSVTRMMTWVSDGSAFAPQLWWEGGWAFAGTRLGMAPSVGLVVSDGAEVLSTSSMRYLRRVEADGTLTFAGETGQLSRLEKGDVVLSGASPEFPNGICRTVTSVGEQGGRVVVETAPAALDDVIDQGEVAFDMHVTENDLPDDGIRAPGVRLERDPAPPGTLPVALGGDNAEGLHFTLTGTILEVAEAEGEVWLDPNAYCDWDIGWTGLESAYYTQQLHVTADLTVSCKQTLTGTKETTLYKRTLTVITIMVGPVPVVVTPVFEVKIGVEGEIIAGVTAGLSIDTMASAGITYDDDGWDKNTGWSFEATPHPPQLFGELTLTGFASAGLAFEVYGVAGPEASLKPYVKLAADVGGDPWWTLSAGLDGEIGFKVEVLDKEVFSKSFELHFFEYPIDQAGSDTSGGGPSDYRAPSVKGRILDTTTGQPIRSASVEIDAGGQALRQASSAADGSYVFSGLSPGTYTVTARKDRYAANSRSVTVVADQTTQGQDVQLTRFEFQGISGHVFTEAGGYPMFDATVRLYEIDEGSWLNDYRSAWTGADGFYKLDDVEPGDYRLVAEHSYYFAESMMVTVRGGQMLEDKDFHLVQHAVQGVSGWIVEDLTGHPISGALVGVRGGDESGGYAEAPAVFTGADGSFVFTGLEVGTHWLTVYKPGYLEVQRSFTVSRATITSLGNVVLKPPGGQSMRATGQDAWIRWTEGVSPWPWGTYEFWFRPTAWGYMEYGNAIAEVSRDYLDWHGDGPHRWPIMRIQYGSAAADPDDVVVVFQINENKGDEWGAWHRLVGTTPVELGHWYHIAAVFGTPGMRLFINGHLEASNDYTGGPEANPGASPGGWFSLGGNDTFPGYQTAVGDYKGLCVADSPRYDDDFTPPDPPNGGSDTLVLDYLIGTTNGENHGFVPTP